MLGCNLERWDGGDVEWIGLAQDKKRLRAVVNSVLSFGFLKMLGNYRVA
jgi:hypothetical protein